MRTRNARCVARAVLVPFESVIFTGIAMVIKIILTRIWLVLFFPMHFSHRTKLKGAIFRGIV